MLGGHAGSVSALTRKAKECLLSAGSTGQPVLYVLGGPAKFTSWCLDGTGLIVSKSFTVIVMPGPALLVC